MKASGRGGSAFGLAADKGAEHLGVSNFSVGELRIMSGGFLSKIKVYTAHSGASGLTSYHTNLLNYLMNELYKASSNVLAINARAFHYLIVQPCIPQPLFIPIRINNLLYLHAAIGF